MNNYKGAVFINAFARYESVFYQVNRLTEEFVKENVSLKLIRNDEIHFFIDSNGNIKSDLEKYDFVIYLDKDMYISQMLEKCGYKLFNSSKAIELCDDKMLTHVALANSDISMPKTISFPLCYSYDTDLHTYEQRLLKEFNYPFLIKENYGSLGKEVYLVNNLNELRLFNEKLLRKPHIFQEFIQESSGIDYRLLLIGHKLVASMKRVNKQSYVSNIASGGIGYLFSPSEEMQMMAVKASKILNLDYCAVDFVIDKNNKPMLIEVNSNAFFTEIEKVTGINIAEKYCDYILKVIKGKDINDKIGE